MKAAKILELDSLNFVEGSFADLADPESALPILSCRPEEGRLLVDENEDLLAVAFKTGDDWIGASYLFHPPESEVIDLFDEIDAEMYQEKREVWAAAMREYYSTELLRTVSPTMEDIPPDRQDKIVDLVREVWEEKEGGVCLDCCCGSGVGAAALRSIGMRPLAYDHDPTLLALGLGEGRLLTDETACIDATDATVYFSPAPYGAVFMMGTIRSFDAEIWEAITAELLELSEETLITVATEEEIRLVAEWCRLAGRTTEVRENTRDPIYDRWVCLARRG
ncbi:hypothetical protein RJ40_05375 [Methanofollis aquaemaris]|uniref:Class I SAM-dependent methyltransferase n=1 Tax=Methanofollis aquaemaris TaxID=126734 RepID=A0A8A3S4H4_9EURY|nr:hypothetical protein [Methanofollis aquaemaris]QSZ66962.1 hypothetical protein RJ40_05375 [Methanofollis aquaemaris]